MLTIFLSTLEKVATLLAFIGIGYFLRRKELLPKEAGHVLGSLCTTIFMPAYIFSTMSKTLVPEALAENGLLILAGVLWLAGLFPISLILAKRMGKTPDEIDSYKYIFLFSNYGYFGYPVVERVFGTETLGKMMLFLLAIVIAVNSYGYSLFVKKSGGFWKNASRILLSPPLLAMIPAFIVGLTQTTLPGVVNDILNGASNCMSPCSMLLGGIVLGSYPLKDLFRGKKGYGIVAIRMLGLPALGVAVCLLLRLKGTFFLFPAAFLCMPLGLNVVVFPESQGRDASPAARMVFQSTLLSLILLPLFFTLIFHLAGMEA